MISVFDLFSIGIGPSSSHTVGPMRAAREFLQNIADKLDRITQLETTIYGSLAFTGVGHGTNKALLMGFEGEKPETIDPEKVDSRVNHINETHTLNLLGTKIIPYNPSLSLIYNCNETFDYHPNGIKFIALDANKKIIAEEIYFSIGGGFIVNQRDIENNKPTTQNVKFPFNSSAELLDICQRNNMSISEVMMVNESLWRDEATIREGLININNIMEACIAKGCITKGTLPGKLAVTRRAPALYQKLIIEGKPSALHPKAMNWLNVFAMAVNEENAAGGRVVTAPTNGAAGIIPAVLHYYQNFYNDADENGVINFLLTAAAVGTLYKKNASISGAEMGCQGEVGVACSMAAAGLAAALKGTIFQIENAAEIGMEHNLGLTCDPVGGLVQIPCIERNAMGAVKAVNAAQLALAEDGSNKISLDMVISTMREIGHNMNSIYKETSQGGLALAVSLSEC